jgi:hypothetical protein
MPTSAIGDVLASSESKETNHASGYDSHVDRSHDVGLCDPEFAARCHLSTTWDQLPSQMFVGDWPWIRFLVCGQFCFRRHPRRDGEKPYGIPRTSNLVQSISSPYPEDGRIANFSHEYPFGNTAMSFVVGFVTGMRTGEAVERRKRRGQFREYLQKRGYSIVNQDGLPISVDQAMSEAMVYSDDSQRKLLITGAIIVTVAVVAGGTALVVLAAL